MKIAVIVGILHMSMGICVKALNSVYFRWWIVLIFEVLTGLIILLGLFGWMDLLIIAKWLTPYQAYNYLLPHGDTATPAEIATYDEAFNAVSNAPSIYTVLINNFLSVGKQPAVHTYAPYTSYDNYLFSSQRGLSELCVVLVIICCPLYLCVKPCVAWCKSGGEHEHDGEQFENINNAAHDAAAPGEDA